MSKLQEFLSIVTERPTIVINLQDSMPESFDDFITLTEGEEKNTYIIYLPTHFWANNPYKEETTSFEGTHLLVRGNLFFFGVDKPDVVTAYALSSMWCYDLNRDSGWDFPHFSDAASHLLVMEQKFHDLIFKALDVEKDTFEILYEERKSKLIMKKIVDVMLESIKKTVEQDKKDLSKSNEDVNAHIQAVGLIKQRIKTLEERMKTYNIQGLEEGLMTDLEKIKKHKKVTKVELGMHKNAPCIDVYTTDIYMVVPKQENRRYLGQMNLKIPLNSSSFGIFNMNNCREGYWHNSPHPHVSSEGNPCLGNADAQFMDMIGNRNYYGVFATLLGYVQTCNPDDVAGKTYKAWDEVDAEGTVIIYGTGSRGTSYAPADVVPEVVNEEEHECTVCGEWHRASEMRVCLHCEEWTCSDCYTEVAGEAVCEDCISEFYYRCHICGVLIHGDAAHYDDDDHPFCSRCWDARVAEAEETRDDSPIPAPIPDPWFVNTTVESLVERYEREAAEARAAAGTSA